MASIAHSFTPLLALRASFAVFTPAGRRYACQRLLHTSSTGYASPLPHPTTPGPPPEPPSPAVTQPEDRVARKRKQAELLQRGRDLRVDPSKPSTVLQKRFWKEVSVEETADGFTVMLDSRPVRTASKNVLVIPSEKRQLATAIALEWDLLVSAHQALKQHYIPLTSLTSRAIDIQTADAEGRSGVRSDLVEMLMDYLKTDTLLCWAPEKNIHEGMSMERGEEATSSLRETQKNVAQPIINYLATRIWSGVEIRPILSEDSILPAPQPQVTLEVIREWLSRLPAFELAGLERAVLAGKSLLVGVRLLVEWSQEFGHLRKGDFPHTTPRIFGVEDAAEACSLEVNWQTSMWGEVEDTHDVDKEDLRRQLGSAVLLVNGRA